MALTLVFSQTHFSLLSIFENGFNRGNHVSFIEKGWEYSINEDKTRHTTKLPCVLDLPKGSETLTFYNVIPDDVTDGDVLRLQTQIGAYRIYVDNQLITEFGQNATEKTYDYDCASSMLFAPLAKADAGKEIRIETSNIYLQYLGMQRAPQVGNHRDILMSDVIDSSSGLLIVVTSGIFAVFFLLQYLFFLLKRQHYPLLLLGSFFLVCLGLYYNTTSFFQFELWGYPLEFFRINDFVYYCLQAFIPILGYVIILYTNTVKLPKPLIVLIFIHGASSILTIALQMLWIVSYGDVEIPLMILTAVCYTGLTICIKPWKLEKKRFWMISPVIVCMIALLLDYYKGAGAWFPFPEEFVAWFQMDLPFMIFLPPTMLLFGMAYMFGVVQWLSAEKAQLDLTAQQASLQIQMLETQYAHMEENQSQFRQLKHDMLHHVRIASGLLAEGRVGDAQEYLGSIGELVTLPDLGQYCESRIGNITLAWFARESARLGIDFQCEADIPTERPEDSTDLCTVLANALQNALEASSGVKRPYIRVVAKHSGSLLFLRVENRFDGYIRRGSNGQILSRKETANHGMGLKGIRKTAEKHAGYFKPIIKDDVFHLEVVLSDMYQGKR